MHESKSQFEAEYREFVSEKDRFLERQNAIITQHELIERLARDAVTNAALVHELQTRQAQLQQQVGEDSKNLASMELTLASFAEKLSQGDLRKLAIREKMRYRTCLASLAELEARVETLTRKLEQHGVDAMQVDAQLTTQQKELIGARSKRDKHQGKGDFARDQLFYSLLLS
jgi:hypothetical protein